ncbi:MAG: aldehyde ferredoxin oxidoreductase N-terminal domain-containing protein, partial [Promethearchaeota archaeon]
MQNIFGNFGKLLNVNLTDGKLTDYKIPESYLLDYIGGKGLGARILWDFLPTDGITDPLGRKNVLVLMSGPLVGLNVFGSSRNVVMTKSPLSKYVAEAYGGG